MGQNQLGQCRQVENKTLGYVRIKLNVEQLEFRDREGEKHKSAEFQKSTIDSHTGLHFLKQQKWHKHDLKCTGMLFCKVYCSTNSD